MKKLLFTVLAGLSLAGAASAQTVIEITGATAFRSAAVQAINAAFAAQGNYSYGFSNTDITGAATTLTSGTNQIWRGGFPGIAGQVIVRTSWNGSVEGIRAVVSPNASNNADYLITSVASTTLAANGGTPEQRAFGVDRELAVADLAFSDVAIGATPIVGTVSGGKVGVVTFTMIGNRTFKDDDGGATAGVTSISAQQFKALCEQGTLPLGFFKGNTTDTTPVYLTGRNDGSGTRTTSLAETGYGISKPVNQYVVHDRSSSTNAPSIVKTAAGGGFNFQNVATPDYQSTVFGQNIDGNGGYASGLDIRTDLSKTTSSTAVFAFVDQDDPEDGLQADEDIQVRAAGKLYLVAFLSTSDARTARTVGSTLAATASAKILGYNGVILDGLAGDNPPATLSAADKAKVANGAYTAWSYQQLYHNNTAAQQAVFSELKTRLNNATIVGGAGLTLGEMNVGRATDGGTVTPGAQN